jgi:hypothetical protein
MGICYIPSTPILPITVGMVPEKKLSAIQSSRSLSKLSKLSGRRPANWLDERRSRRRLVAPVNELKGFPTNIFPSRSTSVNWDKVLSALGTKPCKLLYCKASSRREDNAPISGAIRPMRWFPTAIVQVCQRCQIDNRR